MAPASPTAYLGGMRHLVSLGAWLQRLGIPRAERNAFELQPSTGCQVLLLECGALLRMRAPARYEVRCLEGLLWLTLDGDPGDTTLAIGQALRVDRRGSLVVQALTPATLSIHEGVHP